MRKDIMLPECYNLIIKNKGKIFNMYKLIAWVLAILTRFEKYFAEKYG